MMIGASSNLTLHLSVSNNNSDINTNEKSSKSENGNSNSLKKNNPLQDLMTQKENIKNSRQKYLENALKKNEPADTIKERLAEYDKQSADIDKQISQFKLEERQKALSTNDKENDKTKNNSDQDKETDKTQNNPELDTKNEMMNNLVSLSTNISTSKTLSAVKDSKLGEKKNLENEIETDKAISDSTFQKKSVAKLDDSIDNLQRDIGDNLNNINNSTSDSNNNSDNVDTDNNQNENSENTINENIQSDNSNENTQDKTINESKVDSLLLQTIKNYKENADDNTKTNGQEFNSIV